MKLEDVFCIYKLNYLYIKRDQTCYTVYRLAKEFIWLMILVAVGFIIQHNASVLTGNLLRLHHSSVMMVKQKGNLGANRRASIFGVD